MTINGRKWKGLGSALLLKFGMEILILLVVSWESVN